MVRYENVHKLLDIMPKFVWILKALWRPSCYVVFSTSLKVETWFDYPKNTIMLIKKQPKIYSLDKLLGLAKARTQGCQID
jgi:hypothetical protein